MSKKILYIYVFGQEIAGVRYKDDGLVEFLRFTALAEAETLLKIEKKRGVEQVVIFKDAQVYDLQLQLPDSLDDREHREAVLYAAGSQAGCDIKECSAAWENRGQDRIRYSGIPLEFQNKWKKLLKKTKMKYGGIYSFRPVAANYLPAECKNLLFLYSDSSFLIAAGTIRNLPGGEPAKIMQRLELLPEGELACVLDRGRKDIPEKLPSKTLELAADRYLVELTGKLCLKAHTPAMIPPKPDDPYSSGSWIGGSIIFFILSLLIYLFFNTAWRINESKSDLQERQAIQAKINALTSKTNTIRKEYTLLSEYRDLRLNDKHFSCAYLTVLNLLSRYQLEYTKITALNEGNSAIQIQGETLWQPDAARFFTHFGKELAPFQLRLRTDQMEKSKDGKMDFQISILHNRRSML